MKLYVYALFTFFSGHRCVAVDMFDSSSSSAVLVKEVIAKLAENQIPEQNALDNIEKSLTKLAEQEKTAPSNSSSSWDVFLQQIKTLIETTFKESVLKNKNATQAALDAAWSGSSACRHPDDAINESSVNTLSDAHITCRKEQQRRYTLFVSTSCSGPHNCDMACSLYNQLNSIPDHHTTCVMAPGTAAPTIGTYLREMKVKFIGLRDNLQSAKNTCDQCRNQSNLSAVSQANYCLGLACNYKRATVDCDARQAALEREACGLRKTGSCANYISCHTQKKSAYEAVRNTSQQAAQNFAALWESIERILCYVEALGLNTIDKATAITNCKNAQYSTAPVNINFYGNFPAANSCTDKDSLMPGTALFASRWYNRLPADAPALSCASSCCGAVPDGSNFTASWPAGDPNETTCSAIS
eukprot:TRINITY_DN11197_c0_g1_i1.p1 TRINITY_DN11197_c0_g1~~TRINITY_DN11197_c0_g1_i1.p1  ORF type:complete len:414 (-),score=54.63 TRINITY_DN11197_c0_g1_i1:58-1299(-)